MTQLTPASCLVLLCMAKHSWECGAMSHLQRSCCPGVMSHLWHAGQVEQWRMGQGCCQMARATSA